jgi:hypothetical protein
MSMYNHHYIHIQKVWSNTSNIFRSKISQTTITSFTFSIKSLHLEDMGWTPEDKGKEMNMDKSRKTLER